MQKYYDELYNKIEIKDKDRVANIYNFMDYRAKTKEYEFNQYQSLYGHVVYKYEKMRASSIWKIAKKIKSKLLGK